MRTNTTPGPGSGTVSPIETAVAAHFKFQRMTDKDSPYYDQQVGSTATRVLKGLKGSRVVDEFTLDTGQVAACHRLTGKLGQGSGAPA